MERKYVTVTLCILFVSAACGFRIQTETREAVSRRHGLGRTRGPERFSDELQAPSSSPSSTIGFVASHVRRLRRDYLIER